MTVVSIALVASPDIVQTPFFEAIGVVVLYMSSPLLSR